MEERGKPAQVTVPSAPKKMWLGFGGTQAVVGWLDPCIEIWTTDAAPFKERTQPGPGTAMGGLVEPGFHIIGEISLLVN